MDKNPFASVIDQICEEKGISRERVLETIEMALAAAYKKEYDRKGQSIRVKFDLGTGDMKIFQVKLVVDQSMLKPEVDPEQEQEAEKEEAVQAPEEGEEGEKKVRFNPEKHIMLEDAQKITSKDGAIIPKGKKGKFEPGDEIKFKLEVDRGFGRIAAQTAKQVIIQRIREAEREAIYEEYKEKEGEVVSGIIQRIEKNNVFLDIGKATGVLFPEEQISKEHYRMGQRIKVYIAEVQKDSHGSMIILSRAHPKMISQLFALEVPEISAGTVEIKSIAREAGSRSKIAVVSTEERVDPIGSMIGQRGTRVQAVINELAGEKIDIVEWSDDPAIFISQALSPAKVLGVDINKADNQAKVIVPEDQLSLAIGVKGQNVRLAAKLTGWKIDIATNEAAEEDKTVKKGKKKTTKKTEKKTEKKAKSTDDKKSKKADKKKKKEVEPTDEKPKKAVKKEKKKEK